MTVHGTPPYLPQAPQLPRGPSNVPPGGPPPPHPRRSRSRCDGSAALCAHTPSTGGILWGRKSTKGCRRAARSRRQQPRSTSQALGRPGRGPGGGEPATLRDEGLLPPRSPSPGYPKQRFGRQEGKHTLHHLRKVTQHVGASRICGGGAVAAATAYRLHSSPTGPKVLRRLRGTQAASAPPTT